ncbi:hypothetical protein Lpar_3376 [Legionella parisiensis]|uniref:Uncharacterized protein n=1 Tax=Legionella parisiensis TaxID=45071 RepID=A0A1E5JQV4_9GAMM|nr:hypothetical protein Lpar_3376 [Legionella parisiensis]OEH46428.1 hypothetical protein lpari_02767 [Legionella parisiensis]STX75423.1 Uncharacterised protein [Legionella parisiensis]
MTRPTWRSSFALGKQVRTTSTNCLYSKRKPGFSAQISLSTKQTVLQANSYHLQAGAEIVKPVQYEFASLYQSYALRLH